MSIELSQLLRPAFGFLLSVTLKSTVLLLAATLLALVLRRATAANRHFLWLATLTAVLWLPLMSLLPAWHAPAWAAPVAQRIERINRVMSLATIDLSGLAAASAAVRSGGAEASPATSLSQDLEQGGRSLGLGWRELLFLLWALGVGVHLVRRLAGHGRLRTLAATAQPARNEHWHEAIARHSRQIGLRRPVRLLVSDDAVMPMTWGWRNPVVLLPADAETWPTERLNLVLRHELAHVRRRDCLTQAVADLACALQWFHSRSVVTQNALADNSYIFYLRHLYDDTLVIPTKDVQNQCYKEYIEGALRRKRAGELEDGVDARDLEDGRVSVSGVEAQRHHREVDLRQQS